jgi:hypothetical protein
LSGWEGNQPKVTTILKNMDINMKLLSNLIPMKSPSDQNHKTALLTV